MKKCVALVIVFLLVVSMAVPSFAAEETPTLDEPYHIGEDVLEPIDILDPTILVPIPSAIDIPIEEPIIGVPRPVEEDLEELDVIRWVLRPIWDYIKGFKLSSPLSISELRIPLTTKSVRPHRWFADRLS